MYLNAHISIKFLEFLLVIPNLGNRDENDFQPFIGDRRFRGTILHRAGLIFGHKFNDVVEFVHGQVGNIVGCFEFRVEDPVVAKAVDNCWEGWKH